MNKNPIIFISLAAVRFFEKPYFDGSKWHKLNLIKVKEKFLLSETRCAMLQVPISQDEEPFAYVHSVYGIGEECYIPVYDRTHKVEKHCLYDKEIVTKQ